MGAVLIYERRLDVARPDLSDEWDHERNGCLTPEKTTIGSSRLVWWKCLACGESWLARIRDRCKATLEALSIRLCGCNRLTAVFPESKLVWDYEKNGVFPEQVAFSSNGKRWWKCSSCGVGWYRAPNKMKKFFRGTVRRRLCDCNRLSVVGRDLVSEWHPTRNGDITPEKVAHSANRSVWWLCKEGHEWYASINSRTNLGSGCPFCSGNRPTDKNRLSVCYPEVAAEWDYEKNGGKTPADVSYGGPKAWWRCGICGHSWETFIYNRCRGGKGCPACAKGNISKASQGWLDYLNIPQENREVWVICGDKKYRVDAFDPKTNTIFEFLGDYWHGNPNVFNPTEINPHNKKTFGQLFDETIERLQFFRASAYNLNVVWESPFKRSCLVNNGSRKRSS